MLLIGTRVTALLLLIRLGTAALLLARTRILLAGILVGIAGHSQISIEVRCPGPGCQRSETRKVRNPLVPRGLCPTR
jgi:hypothetical protein